jgi:branched-chain amino acid aminotransferase
VRENQDYCPPYGVRGSLYVRPLLLGTGARLGLAPAPTFLFIVMVIPIGERYACQAHTH